jgi:hypothetical protein
MSRPRLETQWQAVLDIFTKDSVIHIGIVVLPAVSHSLPEGLAGR